MPAKDPELGPLAVSMCCWRSDRYRRDTGQRQRSTAQRAMRELGAHFRGIPLYVPRIVTFMGLTDQPITSTELAAYSGSPLLDDVRAAEQILSALSPSAWATGEVAAAERGRREHPSGIVEFYERIEFRPRHEASRRR